MYAIMKDIFCIAIETWINIFRYLSFLETIFRKIILEFLMILYFTSYQEAMKH